MAFFEKFPKIYYKLPTQEKYTVVRNIFTGVKIRDKILKDARAYVDYYVKESDTPESIAHKLYGSVDYWWIILLSNQIVNPFSGWPMRSGELLDFVKAKYGTDEVHTIHHYEDGDSMVVDSDAVGASSVSNFQYEDRKNELSRKVRLFAPEYIGQIQQEFNLTMRGK